METALPSPTGACGCARSHLPLRDRPPLGPTRRLEPQTGGFSTNALTAASIPRTVGTSNLPCRFKCFSNLLAFKCIRSGGHDHGYLHRPRRESPPMPGSPRLDVIVACLTCEEGNRVRRGYNGSRLRRARRDAAPVGEVLDRNKNMLSRGASDSARTATGVASTLRATRRRASSTAMAARPPSARLCPCE